MSSHSFPTAKFRLGHIVATPNALKLIPEDEIFAAIKRHQAGDWGDLCTEDRQTNDQAVVLGLRILSSYLSKAGERFWIITEGDRSATTILLPLDY